MARYDKYDPEAGGFRAVLSADWVPGTANAADPLNPHNYNKVFAAVLNANGALLPPTGDAGMGAVALGKTVGVVIVSGLIGSKAGDVLDVMTAGEIISFDDGKYAGVVAAQDWYVDQTTGLLKNTAPAAGVGACYVGTTIEPGRLVVRFRRGAVVGT